MSLTSQFRDTPLRGCREGRGLGLNEVARLAEIDPGHLSRIERGMAKPSVDVLARLAKVLELPELLKLIGPYAEDR